MKEKVKIEIKKNHYDGKSELNFRIWNPEENKYDEKNEFSDENPILRYTGDRGDLSCFSKDLLNTLHSIYNRFRGMDIEFHGTFEDYEELCKAKGENNWFNINPHCEFDPSKIVLFLEKRVKEINDYAEKHFNDTDYKEFSKLPECDFADKKYKGTYKLYTDGDFSAEKEYENQLKKINLSYSRQFPFKFSVTAKDAQSVTTQAKKIIRSIGRLSEYCTKSQENTKSLSRAIESFLQEHQKAKDEILSRGYVTLFDKFGPKFSYDCENAYTNKFLSSLSKNDFLSSKQNKKLSGQEIYQFSKSLGKEIYEKATLWLTDFLSEYIKEAYNSFCTDFVNDISVLCGKADIETDANILDLKKTNEIIKSIVEEDLKIILEPDNPGKSRGLFKKKDTIGGVDFEIDKTKEIKKEYFIIKDTNKFLEQYYNNDKIKSALGKICGKIEENILGEFLDKADSFLKNYTDFVEQEANTIRELCSKETDFLSNFMQELDTEKTNIEKLMKDAEKG